MKKRTSFIKLIKLWGIIFLIGIGVSIIAIDFIGSHRDFNFRADQMRADYIALQKQIIKQEVNRVVDLISYEKAQSEILTKEKIKSRVYESYSIAQNIYQQNKTAKSESEIQQMILDTLRPIRFEGGNGYYFATRLDGVEMLFADKPEMEGLNLLDMQDTRGQYVIKNMIEIAEQFGEGFYEYHWTKPHSAGNEFKKISFVKRFEPYDWFIGTGLYVDDVESQIQASLLSTISRMRFGKEGYIFINRLNGDALVSNGELFSGTNKLWEVFNKNPEKMKDIFDKEYNAALKPNGDYIYYSHVKLTTPNKESPKVSFIYGIPDLQWIVGAGVYLDDVEADIALMRTKLNNQIKKKVLFFILIVMGTAVLFFLLFNWLNSGLNNDFTLFISFFNRAAHSDEEINRETIKFVELDQIAEYANKMLTERKQAEKALQEAYSIINRSPVVAFLWENLEGWPVEFVSDNVMELFGYAAEEFTSGQVSYTETIHPDDLDRVAEKVTILSNEKERTSFFHEPYRIISKDGKVRWLDDRTYIRKDNKGNITHYEGIVVDITDSMNAAEVLRENEEKLARAKKMESLGLLAGGVAHDLNNVLSGIVSYPDLLLLELPEDNQFREAIETIKESGDRAVAIVQDLLTVARGVAVTKEPLNLNDLIGDYLHSPEFSKINQFHPTVKVKTNFDTDLLNISGSHVHIRKVLMNLVSNASEAIKGSGNVTISTVNRYIDTPLRGYEDINVGEYAVLSVSDDGSGISSYDLERIFEPFYTKKVMGRSGTGLGLAVVWNVVQDHKGYIDVTSNENGTTFESFFPITREEMLGKNLSIPFKDLKGYGEKILVIDDVESQRVISRKMLEALGYKTKAVSSGEEAVEYLKDNTVDLLLLDMIMDPGINGRKTYERIIKIHPHQKAIIVSGFAETDDVKETQKLGAGKFIRKPLTLERIGLAAKEEMEK